MRSHRHSERLCRSGFPTDFAAPSDPLSSLDFFPCRSLLIPLRHPADHLPSGVIGNAAAHALHHCSIGEYLTRYRRSSRVPEPSRAELALPLASTQPCLHRHLRINLHLLLQTPSSNTAISTCPTRLIRGSPRSSRRNNKPKPKPKPRRRFKVKGRAKARGRWGGFFLPTSASSNSYHNNNNSPLRYRVLPAVEATLVLRR
jgi:hypothetical protein